jgi:hypothetical protein
MLLRMQKCFWLKRNGTSLRGCVPLLSVYHKGVRSGGLVTTFQFSFILATFCNDFFKLRRSRNVLKPTPTDPLSSASHSQRHRFVSVATMQRNKPFTFQQNITRGGKTAHLSSSHADFVIMVRTYRRVPDQTRQSD